MPPPSRPRNISIAAVYIDTNMVRAGVVDHPLKWMHSGCREIQAPPKRYAVIDLLGLAALCGFSERRDFQRAHREWIEEALASGSMARGDRWSEAIAVGSLSFVENVKSELGIKAMHRAVGQVGGMYALQEESELYGLEFAYEDDALRIENTIFWK